MTIRAWSPTFSGIRRAYRARSGGDDDDPGSACRARASTRPPAPYRLDVPPLAGHHRVRVTDAPVARLATVRPDGTPHLVPVTFALDGDAVVTVVDDKAKTTTDLQRLRNIEACPAASVLVDSYEDDWSLLWWVRGDGLGRIEREGRVHDEAVALLAAKYPPYRERPPDGPVVVLAVHRWVWWEA